MSVKNFGQPKLKSKKVIICFRLILTFPINPEMILQGERSVHPYIIILNISNLYNHILSFNKYRIDMYSYGYKMYINDCV